MTRRHPLAGALAAALLLGSTAGAVPRGAVRAGAAVAARVAAGRARSPAGGRAPGPRATAPRRALLPELEALLSRKPDARIGVVQGSFHWVHEGHLELVSAVAKARLPDADGAAEAPLDLVLVVPTREYERKPYLARSFDQRRALFAEAVAERPELAGRVVVSDAAATLRNRPAELLSDLLARYPKARFAYALGADSFNESKAWPGFDEVTRDPRVELVAVGRAGHRVASPARATHRLAGPRTRISSSEIRDALAAGDLSPLAGRVPPATVRALAGELARREEARRSGERLLGPSRGDERSFAALRREAPPGAVDLLDGVDEAALDEEVRSSLARLQGRINGDRRALDQAALRVSPTQLAREAGYTDKLLLDARRGGRAAGRYLHKPATEVGARKQEALSILANLVGVPTPLALSHTFREAGARHTARDGVAIPWIEGLETAQGYDNAAASPKAREALLVSRWFNEVVGNQDVWWGQFLRPAGGAGRNEEILSIDHDSAWVRREGEAVQRALRERFGIERPIEDTRWTDKRFSFRAPIAWDPAHYDSRYTMYGPLLRDYVTGRVDVDLERVKAQVRRVGRLPRRALENALGGYVAAAGREGWGTIDVQAAGRSVPERTFAREQVARIYRSVEQFCGLLDELAAARRDPGHPMRRFYEAMPERGF